MVFDIFLVAFVFSNIFCAIYDMLDPTVVCLYTTTTGTCEMGRVNKRTWFCTEKERDSVEASPY